MKVVIDTLTWDMPKKEIAKKLGTSEECVLQIYIGAMRKLRHYLIKNKALREEWQEMMRELGEARGRKSSLPINQASLINEIFKGF